ncbi:MAG: hypothetical protein ACI37N_14400, partial [Prevotella sp.]
MDRDGILKQLGEQKSAIYCQYEDSGGSDWGDTPLQEEGQMVCCSPVVDIPFGFDFYRHICH